MARCQICWSAQANWSWQPWGPGEDPRGGFCASGWHHRGFPVVRVCDGCKGLIQRGGPVAFSYRDQQYQLGGSEVNLI